MDIVTLGWGNRILTEMTYPYVGPVTISIAYTNSRYESSMYNTVIHNSV